MSCSLSGHSPGGCQRQPNTKLTRLPHGLGPSQFPLTPFTSHIRSRLLWVADHTLTTGPGHSPSSVPCCCPLLLPPLYFDHVEGGAPSLYSFHYFWLFEQHVCAASDCLFSCLPWRSPCGYFFLQDVPLATDCVIMMCLSPGPPLLSCLRSGSCTLGAAEQMIDIKGEAGRGSPGI